MQLKKPDENSPASEYLPKQPSKSSHDQDIVRKKVSFLGVGAGIVVAALLGSWLWNHEEPHSLLEKKLMEAENKLTGADKSADDTEKDKVTQENTFEENKPVVESAPVAESLPQPKEEVNKAITAAPQLSNPVETKQNVQPATNSLNHTKSINNEKNTADEEDDFTPPPLLKQSAKPTSKSVSELPPQMYQYNVLNAGPVISAAQGASIDVSRDAHFKSIYVRGKTDQFGEFRITNPPPGIIYWRVKGENAIHKIIISPPTSAKVDLKIPNTLNLEDTISWTANADASFYKLEVAADSSFVNSLKEFSTTETSIKASVMGVGTWFIRVASLNLKSGTFDYSPVNKVTVLAPVQKQEYPPLQ